MTTIGLIGAGNIGSNLAKALVTHGYDVVISNSRGPETLADLVAQLGPKARAATASEAAEAAEIVVVTIPLREIDKVPAEPLAGKIVIDTSNYYPQRDGQIAALDDETTTVSEMVQAHLSGSKVVKGFNHIGAAQIPADGLPSGTPHRRALALFSNYPDAAATVAEIVDAIGYDPLVITPLSEGWRIQRDTPGYGPNMTAEALRAALASAKRYRDM